MINGERNIEIKIEVHIIEKPSQVIILIGSMSQILEKRLAYHG